MIVDSHALVGNNMERYHVPSSPFSPVTMSYKMIAQYQSQDVDLDTAETQNVPSLQALTWDLLIRSSLFFFFFGRFLGIFSIYVFCKYRQFYLFPSGLYIVPFSCLIALARTSSTVLNRRVMGSDILALFPVWERTPWPSAVKNTVSRRVRVDAFMKLRKFPRSYFSWAS